MDWIRQYCCWFKTPIISALVQKLAHGSHLVHLEIYIPVKFSYNSINCKKLSSEKDNQGICIRLKNTDRLQEILRSPSVGLSQAHISIAYDPCQTWAKPWRYFHWDNHKWQPWTHRSVQLWERWKHSNILLLVTVHSKVGLKMDNLLGSFI